MNNPSLLQDSMQDIVTVMSPLRQQLRSNKKFIESLLHIFQGVSDFRNQLKVQYKLENILCICLLAAMRGKFTSFSYLADYIRVKACYFRKFHLIEGDKIPSHDTFRRIFAYLDADELRDVLIRRIKTLIDKIVAAAPEQSQSKLKLISGDGKTFNGSGRKNQQRKWSVHHDR